MLPCFRSPCTFHVIRYLITLPVYHTCQPMYAKTASPSKYPAPTNTRFHKNTPSAELTVYLAKSIFNTPAGIEISVRTIGISLPIKIPTQPRFLMSAKFRSTAGRCFGNFSRYFSSITLPPAYPTAYKIQLPATPARSVMIMTPAKLIFPRAAITPESGMITPAGNPGRFIYSSRTMTKIAIAPYWVK